MKKNKPAIVSLIRWIRLCAVVICLALPLMGGWCQRYRDKSERMKNMRHYYDSVLRAERKYKDSISHVLRQREADSLRKLEKKEH